MLAVHISDGVLLPTWLVIGLALALTGIGFALRGVREEEIPRIALMTAGFFVASLIHVPIGIGKVHLLLNGLVGVLLGRRAILAVAVGLLLQAILVSHGGVAAWGVNVCVMALPAYFCAGLYRRLPVRSEFVAGVCIGVSGVMLTATLNYIGIRYGAMPEVRGVSAWIWFAHLPVAIVEGLIVGFTLEAVRAARPDWLPEQQRYTIA